MKKPSDAQVRRLRERAHIPIPSKKITSQEKTCILLKLVKFLESWNKRRKKEDVLK